jgi:hypothetical protein
VPQRFALPPLITASKWRDVWGSLWSQLLRSRGVVNDAEGTVAPRMTNREAVAVVEAVRDLARKAGAQFPLWYQFAAIAYGWAPDHDELDTSQEQSDRVYDADASVMLQLEVQEFTGDLDDRNTPDPRIDLTDVFDHPSYRAEVAAALGQDGAQALFKIPIPACKDPKTGKPAKPVRDPKTGKWTCPGGAVTIDDPLTAILKELTKVIVPIGLIVLVIGLAADNATTRRSRKRR